MPIVDTKTGKVLVADKQLIKDAKKWLAGYTEKELSEMIRNQIIIAEGKLNINTRGVKIDDINLQDNSDVNKYLGKNVRVILEEE